MPCRTILCPLIILINVSQLRGHPVHTNHTGFPHQQQAKLIILAYFKSDSFRGWRAGNPRVGIRCFISVEESSPGSPLDCQICLFLIFKCIFLRGEVLNGMAGRC